MKSNYLIFLATMMRISFFVFANLFVLAIGGLLDVVPKNKIEGVQHKVSNSLSEAQRLLQNKYGNFKTNFTHAVSGAPDHCEITLDAALLAADGHIYLFSGRHVWKLRQDADREVEKGFPQLITTIWGNDAPADLNAALALANKIFFFKGERYWRYTGGKLDGGYPRELKEVELPNDLDAAFFLQNDNRTYFMKGDLYYRHALDSNKVDPGYPHQLNTTASLKGIPSGVNAALQTTSNHLYFFKGNRYYRFSDGKFQVDSGYPKSLHAHWLGCHGSEASTTTANDRSSSVSYGGRVYQIVLAGLVFMFLHK